MLVSKNARICFTPNAKPKICVTPTRNPNASQWNIGCVGSSGGGACVGHVHFRLLCQFHLRLPMQTQFGVSQRIVVKLVLPYTAMQYHYLISDCYQYIWSKKCYYKISYHIELYCAYS